MFILSLCCLLLVILIMFLLFVSFLMFILYYPTNKQTSKQTNKQTNKQANKQASKQASKQEANNQQTTSYIVFLYFVIFSGASAGSPRPPGAGRTRRPPAVGASASAAAAVFVGSCDVFCFFVFCVFLGFRFVSLCLFEGFCFVPFSPLLLCFWGFVSVVAFLFCPFYIFAFVLVGLRSILFRFLFRAFLFLFDCW